MDSLPKNFVYKTLVKNKQDLNGMIAYSLYKENVIDYIETYHSNHNGTAPNDNDLWEHKRNITSEKFLEDYKKDATDLLNMFLYNLESKKKKGSFWKSVLTNIFSNFCWGVILLILTLFIAHKFPESNLGSFLKRFF